MTNIIPMLVLTGGPCAGKSTVLEYLRAQLPEAAFVPEAATLLLSGGYPLPGREVEYSDHWRYNFQGAILDLQLRLEAFWAQEARETYKRVLVLDRGALDGAAYLPGGAEENADTYGLSLESTLDRYYSIYHLESLATGDPASYGKRGNAERMESLEEAAQLELKTREAWRPHPRHTIFAAEPDLVSKAEKVLGQIRMDLVGLD